MDLLSENKIIWEKLNNNLHIEYKDIEKYIFTNEYINAFENNDFFEKKIYNDDLFMYSFEVEEYESEIDYKEVFFQQYLDNDISKTQYLYHENKFIEMMKVLFNTGKTMVFYTLEVPLDKNSPAQNSKDVIKDFDKISSYSNEVVCIDDWEFFKQICYIAAREIDCVLYMFPEIQAVVLNSGLHGYVFSEVPLSNELKNKLSEKLNFKSTW